MTIASHWPQPTEILDHYKRFTAALAALRRELTSGAGAASQFFGMTPQDVEKALREMATELDHEVTLLLTASFGASFQVDYHQRLKTRKKDLLSKKLRALTHAPVRRRSPRVTIEEILDVWQDESGHKRLIGQLKQLIQFRHWLAHGRYWVQKSGLRGISPFDAWQRGKAVFDVLPGFRPLGGP
jgi:hypothetical protein